MDGSDMSAAPSSTVTENRSQRRQRLKAQLAQLEELASRIEARRRVLLAVAEPTSSHDSRNNVGSDDVAVSYVHGEGREMHVPPNQDSREESLSRQNSGTEAELGNELETEMESNLGGDVFTKERRAVGARMSVTGNDFEGYRRKSSAAVWDSAGGEGDLAYEGPDADAWNQGGSLGEGLDVASKRKLADLAPEPDRSPKRQRTSEVIAPATWDMCFEILSELVKEESAWPFKQAVSVLWPGLDDYYRMIKEPMDLGSVHDTLVSGGYAHPKDYARDVRLTFANAMKYNDKSSEFYLSAKKLRAKFDSRYRTVERRLQSSAAVNRDEEVMVRYPPPAPVYAHISEVKELRTKSIAEPPVTKLKGSRPAKSGKSAARDKLASADPKSGAVVDPRLGRAKSAKAYGGPRPLTQKEKLRLTELVQDLPEDRQNMIYKIVSQKVEANADAPQQETAEFDMNSIDQDTMFEIYRVTMNWQKSKSKVLGTKAARGAAKGLGAVKEDGGKKGGKLKQAHDNVRQQPVETVHRGGPEDEDVDIMNDSPRREERDAAGAAKNLEISAAGGESLLHSSSGSSSSESSSSGSSGSDTSSSGSDSDADSAEKV